MNPYAQTLKRQTSGERLQVRGERPPRSSLSDEETEREPAEPESHQVIMKGPRNG